MFIRLSQYRKIKRWFLMPENKREYHHGGLQRSSVLTFETAFKSYREKALKSEKPDEAGKLIKTAIGMLKHSIIAERLLDKQNDKTKT